MTQLQTEINREASRRTLQERSHEESISETTARDGREGTREHQISNHNGDGTGVCNFGGVSTADGVNTEHKVTEKDNHRMTSTQDIEGKSP